MSFSRKLRRRATEIQKSLQKIIMVEGKRPWLAAGTGQSYAFATRNLVQDNVTLPIQRLREAVSDLIKTSEDNEIGLELLDCNRRLEELREQIALFLGQSADDYVYWVERTGKAQRTIALNAAPIDVAEYLRRRLFRTDTSVVMASATLATSVGHSGQDAKPNEPNTHLKRSTKTNVGGGPDPLLYFSRRIGAEMATKLQVGTPFDYERQMKLFVVNKMPDPREDGYRDALKQWNRTFYQANPRKSICSFY
jgi:ATP-dependent DNA helicase DinG